MMKDVLCGSQPFCLNVDDIVVNDEKLLTRLCLIVLVIFTSKSQLSFWCLETVNRMQKESYVWV